MGKRWAVVVAKMFSEEAETFQDFVAGITTAETRDLPRLAEELGLRLQQFGQRCAVAGAAPVQIRPAALALGVLADNAVRAKPRVDLTTWSALARQSLFDGRDVTVRDIREYQRIADTQGSEFVLLAGFLDDCLSQLTKKKPLTVVRPTGGKALAFVVLMLFLGLAGYVAFLEARFHNQVFGAFTALDRDLGLRGRTQSAEIVVGLNALSDDQTHIRQVAQSAPLRGVVTLPFADAVGAAEAQYRDTVADTAGPLLADAIRLALATEGQGLALYDSLRAYGILSGQTDWEPMFLSGWVAAREDTYQLAGFADHVALLPGPITALDPPDPLIMDQARVFAGQTDEAARAWLELLRGKEVRSLPTWSATDAVPLLDQVALRRSGAPLQVPGLYTADGWALARDVTAGVAVQKTRSLAQTLFGQALPQQNNTPDLVMERMQAETIAYWQDWLSDLRVRPFDSAETGIIVSGTLAQEWSPLPLLLQEVWAQVGGNDRDRPRPLQTQIARAFGPTIQYVEQGRMTEIAAQFASANVALTTKEIDAERGDLALLNVASRVRSIQSLKAAPAVVALLVEDTLAQISSGGQSGDNAIGRAWAGVYQQCLSIGGRYPFGEGPDLPLQGLQTLFGPTGGLPLFFKQFAAPNLEMGQSPWRWKTEARFAGLNPEGAGFLEKAMAINAALFVEGRFGADVTVTALAERGQATLSLGGAAIPVRANAAPAPLQWPGRDPSKGISLQFQGSPVSATLTSAGTWGMLRLFDDLRLRPRNDGQRFLIDMRDDVGRLFLAMDFEVSANPVAARSLMNDFQCPERL